MDQRILELPRAKRSVRIVLAIGERFRGNSKTGLTENIEHRGSGKAHQRYGFVPARDSVSDCLRERSIVYRLVVKCAVRLDVCDTRTKAVRDFAENTDLFKGEIG